MAYDHEEQEQLATLKSWWKQYGNLVTWSLVAVLLAYSAWTGWNLYQRNQAAQAAVLSDEAARAAHRLRPAGGVAGGARRLGCQ
jgi:predicted negative regulator of RcsB-dependent stress response